MIQKSQLERLIFEEIHKPNIGRILGYTHKVPQLKQILISLLSPQYVHFIKDIEMKSPKPTTFQVALDNDFTFLLTYIGKDIFQAKISGKEYNLDIAGEIDRASKAITNLLVLKKPLNQVTSVTPDDTQPPTNQTPTDVGSELPPEVEVDNNSLFQPLK